MEKDEIMKAAKARAMQAKKDKKKDSKSKKDDKKDGGKGGKKGKSGKDDKKDKKNSKSKPNVEENENDDNDNDGGLSNTATLTVEEEAKIDGLNAEIEEFERTIKSDSFEEYRKECHEILLALMKMMMYGTCGAHQVRRFNQFRYDACHIYMVHLIQFSEFMIRNTKSVAEILWAFIQNHEECKKFLLTYHLHTMINFERRWSPKQLQAKLQEIDDQIQIATIIGRRKLLKERDELQFMFTHYKPFVDGMVLRFKSILPNQLRDCSVVRVLHELRYDNFPEWKITPECFDRIWKKIDEKRNDADKQLYDNRLRKIIYEHVSRAAKLKTIKSITPQELGISVIDRVFDENEDIHGKIEERQLGLSDEHRAFRESSQKWTDKYLQRSTVGGLKKDGINENDSKTEEKGKEDGGSNNQRKKLTAAQTKYLHNQANRVFVELQERFGVSYDQATKFFENTRMAHLQANIDNIHQYFGNFPSKMVQMLCNAELNEQDKQRAQYFVQNTIENYKRAKRSVADYDRDSLKYGSYKAFLMTKGQEYNDIADKLYSTYNDIYNSNLQKMLDDVIRDEKVKQHEIDELSHKREEKEKMVKYGREYQKLKQKEIEDEQMRIREAEMNQPFDATARFMNRRMSRDFQKWDQQRAMEEFNNVETPSTVQFNSQQGGMVDAFSLAAGAPNNRDRSAPPQAHHQKNPSNLGTVTEAEEDDNDWESQRAGTEYSRLFDENLKSKFGKYEGSLREYQEAAAETSQFAGLVDHLVSILEKENVSDAVRSTLQQVSDHGRGLAHKTGAFEDRMRDMFDDLARNKDENDNDNDDDKIGHGRRESVGSVIDMDTRDDMPDANRQQTTVFKDAPMKQQQQQQEQGGNKGGHLGVTVRHQLSSTMTEVEVKDIAVETKGDEMDDNLDEFEDEMDDVIVHQTGRRASLPNGKNEDNEDDNDDENERKRLMEIVEGFVSGDNLEPTNDDLLKLNEDTLAAPSDQINWLSKEQMENLFLNKLPDDETLLKELQFGVTRDEAYNEVEFMQRLDMKMKEAKMKDAAAAEEEKMREEKEAKLREKEEMLKRKHDQQNDIIEYNGEIIKLNEKNRDIINQAVSEAKKLSEEKKDEKENDKESSNELKSDEIDNVLLGTKTKEAAINQLGRLSEEERLKRKEERRKRNQREVSAKDYLNRHRRDLSSDLVPGDMSNDLMSDDIKQFEKEQRESKITFDYTKMVEKVEEFQESKHGKWKGIHNAMFLIKKEEREIEKRKEFEKRKEKDATERKKETDFNPDEILDDVKEDTKVIEIESEMVQYKLRDFNEFGEALTELTRENINADNADAIARIFSKHNDSDVDVDFTLFQEWLMLTGKTGRDLIKGIIEGDWLKFEAAMIKGGVTLECVEMVRNYFFKQDLVCDERCVVYGLKRDLNVFIYNNQSQINAKIKTESQLVGDFIREKLNAIRNKSQLSDDLIDSIIAAFVGNGVTGESIQASCDDGVTIYQQFLILLKDHFRKNGNKEWKDRSSQLASMLVKELCMVLKADLSYNEQEPDSLDLISLETPEELYYALESRMIENKKLKYKEFLESCGINGPAIHEFIFGDTREELLSELSMSQEPNDKTLYEFIEEMQTTIEIKCQNFAAFDRPNSNAILSWLSGYGQPNEKGIIDKRSGKVKEDTIKPKFVDKLVYDERNKNEARLQAMPLPKLLSRIDDTGYLKETLKMDDKNCALMQNAKQKLCLHLSHLRQIDVANVIYSLYNSTNDEDLLVYYYAFAMEGVSGRDIIDAIEKRATREEYAKVDKAKKFKAKAQENSCIFKLKTYLINTVFKTIYDGAKSGGKEERVDNVVTKIASHLYYFYCKFGGNIPRILFEENSNANSRTFIASGNCKKKEIAVAPSVAAKHARKVSSMKNDKKEAKKEITPETDDLKIDYSDIEPTKAELDNETEEAPDKNFIVERSNKGKGKFMVRYEVPTKVVKEKLIADKASTTIAFAETENMVIEKFRKTRQDRIDSRLQDKLEKAKHASQEASSKMKDGIFTQEEKKAMESDSDSDDNVAKDVASHVRKKSESVAKHSREASRIDWNMFGLNNQEAGHSRGSSHLSLESASQTQSGKPGHRPRQSMGRLTMMEQDLHNLGAFGQQIQETAASKGSAARDNQYDAMLDAVIQHGEKKDAQTTTQHHRRLSSHHFVKQFLAKDKDKVAIVEQAMAGESPLQLYYLDIVETRDEHGGLSYKLNRESSQDGSMSHATMMSMDLEHAMQTAIDEKENEDESGKKKFVGNKVLFGMSAKDVFLDDMEIFDEVVKYYSYVKTRQEKKSKQEFEQMRKKNESLENEVMELRKKKQELVRWIAAERDAYTREKQELEQRKREAAHAQAVFEDAVTVVKDKFNESAAQTIQLMKRRDALKKDFLLTKSRVYKEQLNVTNETDRLNELIQKTHYLHKIHNTFEYQIGVLSDLCDTQRACNEEERANLMESHFDLSAFISSIAQKIKRANQQIEKYKKEIVNARMELQNRAAELRNIKKNPSSNRVSATVGYYEKERTMFEERLQSSSSKIDTFNAVKKKWQEKIKHYVTSIAAKEEEAREMQNQIVRATEEAEDLWSKLLVDVAKKGWKHGVKTLAKYYEVYHSDEMKSNSNSNVMDPVYTQRVSERLMEEQVRIADMLSYNTEVVSYNRSNVMSSIKDICDKRGIDMNKLKEDNGEAFDALIQDLGIYEAPVDKVALAKFLREAWLEDKRPTNNEIIQKLNQYNRDELLELLPDFTIPANDDDADNIINGSNDNDVERRLKGNIRRPQFRAALFNDNAKYKKHKLANLGVLDDYDNDTKTSSDDKMGKFGRDVDLRAEWGLISHLSSDRRKEYMEKVLLPNVDPEWNIDNLARKFSSDFNAQLQEHERKVEELFDKLKSVSRHGRRKSTKMNVIGPLADHDNEEDDDDDETGNGFNGLMRSGNGGISTFSHANGDMMNGMNGVGNASVASNDLNRPPSAQSDKSGKFSVLSGGQYTNSINGQTPKATN